MLIFKIVSFKIIHSHFMICTINPSDHLPEKVKVQNFSETCYQQEIILS